MKHIKYLKRLGVYLSVVGLLTACQHTEPKVSTPTLASASVSEMCGTAELYNREYMATQIADQADQAADIVYCAQFKEPYQYNGYALQEIYELGDQGVIAIATYMLLFTKVPEGWVMVAEPYKIFRINIGDDL